MSAETGAGGSLLETVARELGTATGGTAQF